MEKEFYKISPKGERRIKFQLNASLNEYSENKKGKGDEGIRKRKITTGKKRERAI